jgi:hypothetical protein
MSTARRAQLVLAGLFLLGVVVQFYLAGRGVFGAGDYEPHKAVGHALEATALLLVIAAVAFPETRTGADIGMAVTLLVLTGLQTALAKAGNGDVAALHPLNAALILGGAIALVSRSRRLGAAAPA